MDLKTENKKGFRVEASLLSSHFAKLGEEIQALESANIDGIHLDIMDAHFVPHLSFGPVVVQSLRALTSLPFTAHLMVSQPHLFLQPFALAGVNCFIFHLEALSLPSMLLKEIRSLGLLAGLSIKPETPVENLFPFLHDLDVVLIMTVEPGRSGQTFLTKQARKIQRVRERVSVFKKPPLIAVDGGINSKTVHFVKEADILVSGDYILKSKDYFKSISRLKNSKL